MFQGHGFMETLSYTKSKDIGSKTDEILGLLKPDYHALETSKNVKQLFEKTRILITFRCSSLTERWKKGRCIFTSTRKR